MTKNYNISVTSITKMIDECTFINLPNIGENISNTESYKSYLAGYHFSRDLENLSLKESCKVLLPYEFKSKAEIGNLEIDKIISSLNESLKNKKEFEEYKQELIKLSENKIVAIPFFPGCDIITKDGMSQRVKEIVIKFIKADTKFKLAYNIIAKNEIINRNELVLKMEDYGYEWASENVQICRDIIKFSNIGLIRPIEFRTKKESYIIDNTGLYFLNEKESKIIGKWKNNNIILSENIPFSIEKRLVKLEKIISIHRRFIAPIFMIQHNIINEE